jgi:hypothetical protein
LEVMVVEDETLEVEEWDGDGGENGRRCGE